MTAQSPNTEPSSERSQTDRSDIELLSPAGDWECVSAAVENGANAVYFGLDCGFNARFRAKNFGLADLTEVTEFLRRRGVRGYVTLNTLVFPSEMKSLVGVLEQIAVAGVDAVLVQDFGVARMVRTICPELEVHASTQMSLTSAETIAVADELGLSRVVLPRELSITEIRKIAAACRVPLEVFIHGALCVAYSGQCLTSESLGGRSANRGQCAQACRLPYELICDGEDRDLGEVKYLLSPQDLAGYAAIPDLIAAGVQSLKIEGRLKTPEYVANITGHYRRAIDQAIDEGTVNINPQAQREMELSFSRGFSPGWLAGNDHKRLVPGLRSSKQGIELGTLIDLDRERVLVDVSAPISLGDGLSIGQQGGRVYSLHDSNGVKTRSLSEGQRGWIGFGRHEIDWSQVSVGDVIFKNDDPELNRRLRQSFSSADPVRRRWIDLHVIAITGQPLQVTAKLSDATTAEVCGDEPLAAARNRPIEQSILREKLGRLGGTTFQLRTLTAEIVGEPMVPMGMLNRVRRDLVGRLDQQLKYPVPPVVDVAAGERLLLPIDDDGNQTRQLPPVPMLVVLCRSLDQLRSACRSGADLVYADFHDIRQYGQATELARSYSTPLGLASVRIQKPGEFGLLKVLGRHQPDFLLARNLAAIKYGRDQGIPVIADFSLNVANHRSAEWIRSLGAQRITASYDLNRDQLADLIGSCPAGWMEIVIHQHMPMFHMEHCVFCSVLSSGTDKTNCGRPCDDHVVQLRDRVGAEHTLQADVACRNTLYNATPQSGAETVANLIASNVAALRIELLNEDTTATAKTIEVYRSLLNGRVTADQVWRTLQATNRLGVTRGTLEPKRNPLAIL